MHGRPCMVLHACQAGSVAAPRSIQPIPACTPCCTQCVVVWYGWCYTDICWRHKPWTHPSAVSCTAVHSSYTPSAQTSAAIGELWGPCMGRAHTQQHCQALQGQPQTKGALTHSCMAHTALQLWASRTAWLAAVLCSINHAAQMPRECLAACALACACRVAGIGTCHANTPHHPMAAASVRGQVVGPGPHPMVLRGAPG